jgi:hypothetical protein
MRWKLAPSGWTGESYDFSHRRMGTNRIHVHRDCTVRVWSLCTLVDVLNLKAGDVVPILPSANKVAVVNGDNDGITLRYESGFMQHGPRIAAQRVVQTLDSQDTDITIVLDFRLSVVSIDFERKGLESVNLTINDILIAKARATNDKCTLKLPIAPRLGRYLRTEAIVKGGADTITAIATSINNVRQDGDLMYA